MGAGPQGSGRRGRGGARQGRGPMAAGGPGRRRFLRKASHWHCRHGFTPAQYVTTMSRRPPRNFRQRQADSGSSSDPDSDPRPSSDSGLGRAAKRALGAARNRGRARVWATSRREGPSHSGRGPLDVSGAGEGPPTSPEADGDSPAPDALREDAKAGPRDPSGSASDLDSCGEGASDDQSGSLVEPARGRRRRRAEATEDYLPLSGGPRDPLWGVRGAGDTDSEEEPAPVAAEIQGSDSGSEEAQDAWEAQQMRKALRAPDPGAEPGLPHDRPPGKRTWDLPVSLPPVNLAIIKRQLNSRLASLEGVHRSHQREYERRLQDVVSAKSAVADLEKAPDPAPTCAFYRAMKAYLAALVDCLREKIGDIQQLEAAMQSLLRERAAALWKRRQAELRSEAARLQQLAASMTDDAPAPDGLAEGVVGTQDVLGEPAVWSMQKTQATESPGTSRHQEGASGSDDEYSGTPSEGADFRERRGAILQNCHSIFEDVNEEFSDVQKILLKFQQWREQFPDSYYEAYASLCLPKLLSPFIRIQMMDWNPLKPDCVSLQRMPWFQSLEEFANSGAVVQRDSPDKEILPAALDKTVLPHITGFVQFLWDPLSTPQTRSLVERCREVLSLSPAPRGRKGHATQELRDSVVSRLKKAVEDDVFIPLYPKRVLEDRESPHSRFQERQFQLAVKLLGNVVLWEGLVPEGALRELALDKLLSRYLVIGLSSTCPGPGLAAKYRGVVESLPQSWLGGDPAGPPVPQLANLVLALVRAAQQLHDHELGSEVREMVLLLVEMRAAAQARAFVERNGLERLRACLNGPR
ncbi:intron Large complex component GCFC2 isoform X2 [Antechinus flavipes]|uniref:intron Large complex component GCFC2 isoform X2 n=1 Tax=Antechinus flavipes TaxID=38775 RepID=UPI00223561AE|nr:intron Large complex component GCFC2 isoform X2 [Antechinus flavipes]XP_051830011.1 intron Large complex component GCFC2 isoform X2 [Antechinus flavipes]XP_051830012.1 intron Large complex component GCFC2 isoform X2 [Antechinus flavipes]XP_051830013.1 intron Large complex component GCFC2 isoform X2 [Antechinus flavipes]XP_051830014.1 intron Large complex component GCFC2 isoform X2 [Antechinus flavipes]